MRLAVDLAEPVDEVIGPASVVELDIPETKLLDGEMAEPEIEVLDDEMTELEMVAETVTEELVDDAPAVVEVDEDAALVATTPL